MRHLIYLSLCVLLACGDKQPAPEAAPAAPAEKAVAPATPAPAPATPPTQPAELPQAEAGGLRFDHTAPLVRRVPKSQMRAAEYGVEGDASAELTVFFFGTGMGGDTESNLTRWMDQFTQPDGSDTRKKAVRSQRKVGTIPVTMIEVKGTYTGGMAMPGSAEVPAQQNAMLLGAIATGPSGPVFFKLVGPSAAVESARGAFDAMISSLRDMAPN